MIVVIESLLKQYTFYPTYQVSKRNDDSHFIQIISLRSLSQISLQNIVQQITMLVCSLTAPVQAQEAYVEKTIKTKGMEQLMTLEITVVVRQREW